MNLEKSCGAVVFTRDKGDVQYVLVQSLGGEYGFPKGHMEANETEEETALREIMEEVHIRPRLIPGFRATTEYILPDKEETSKRVVFFLAEYEKQEIIAQNEELKSAFLASFSNAIRMLSHEDTRSILRKADQYLKGNALD